MDSTLRAPLKEIEVRTIRAEVLGAARAASSQSERLTLGTAEGNDLVVEDPFASRFHAEVSVTPAGFRVIDRGSTNGTFSGAVRIADATVQPGSVIRVGRTDVRLSVGDEAKVELYEGDALGGFVGRSTAARRVMAQATKAARSSISVLVTGESGTGKEVIARAIHDMGPRAGEPFEVVDCGALVPTLIASELFGHERGAFTGAERQHVGAFERAGGGTVFLDEVGELPLSVQAALLGAIERKRFRRVGGRADIALGARLVSATHRDLHAMANDGTFRADLVYRLAVVTLSVPPLRERADDIPILVERFLRDSGHEGPVEAAISDAAMATLTTHRWSGNVRELRNFVEAIVAMGEMPPLRGPEGSSADPFADVLGLPYKTARARILDRFEAQYLPDLLSRSGGNVARAAREAKMDRSHLIDLLRRRGL